MSTMQFEKDGNRKVVPRHLQHIPIPKSEVQLGIKLKVVTTFCGRKFSNLPCARKFL